MKRRTLLAAGAAGLGSTLVAACSGGSAPEPPPTPRPTTPDVPPALRRTPDRYRPRFHFSPASGNLADPNGLTYADGEYHLFHQADGRWAHAVSPDRLRWTDLPVALEHDDLGQALSGSAVADTDGRTAPAAGEPALLAFYTSTEGGEAQSLAVGTDGGRTWRRVEQNPVVANGGRKDFRDPKVLRHEPTDRWVMVVAEGDRIGFYASEDLLAWDRVGEFGPGQGLTTAVWECPDLFELPLDGDEDETRWVLHLSVGDSDATAGSTAQYFVGRFDGTTFVNENPPDRVLQTDVGPDFYAAQTWDNDPDGKRVWLGWMSSWRYPYQAPTGPWRGAMSLPRELALEDRGEGPQLVQRAVDVSDLVEREETVDPLEVDGERRLDVRGDSYEFRVRVTFDDDDDVDEVGLRLRSGRGGRGVAVGASLRDRTVFVDRSRAGLAEIATRSDVPFQFGRRYSAADVADRRSLELHGFVDACSVEVFVDDGLHAMTSLVFPRPDDDGLEWYAEGGTARVEEMTVRHLRPIWDPA